jgi:hypothetical protein
MHRHVLLLLGVSGAQLLALLVRQAGAFSPPPSSSCLPSASTAGVSTRTQQAKSTSSWAPLLFPARANSGYFQTAAPFESNYPRYAVTATAAPSSVESEQQQQQQQQQQQASPPKEKIEVLPRLGRIKAMSLLQSLVDELRQQQGGDGSRPSSTSSAFSSLSSPFAFPSSALDEEVEPFYALAQRCRQSDLPDIVLEVLNSYRAMASPGALSIGRSSLTYSLLPSLPPSSCSSLLRPTTSILHLFITFMVSGLI